MLLVVVRAAAGSSFIEVYRVFRLMLLLPPLTLGSLVALLQRGNKRMQGVVFRAAHERLPTSPLSSGVKNKEREEINCKEKREREKNKNQREKALKKQIKTKNI